MTNDNRRTILVIEDEDLVRRAIRRTLVRGGYDVLEASDGASGIAIAIINKVDLILLDMRMPGMHGLEVARILRCEIDTLLTPIVFLTGFGDTESCVAGFAAGAFDFIRKPFNADELIARIESVLRGSFSDPEVFRADPAVGSPDSRARVLLVEDDDAHAATLMRLLSQHAIEVRHEKSAEGFRHAIIEEDPDLIILDVMLPDGIGLDLIRLVRGAARLHTVPVMITSGLADIADRVAGLDAGADDYVTKPVQSAEFIARAQSAIRRGREMRHRREEYARLAAGAACDSKTGLAHHGTLIQRLGEELERSRRHKRPLTVLLLDIDHFKNWNDLHGHIAGDDLLRSFAFMLKRRARKCDLPARFGGEEFVLMLPETSRIEGARIAEEFRRRVEAELKITISIGVAEVSGEETIPEDLLARADKALYRAKAGGRNRVEVDPLSMSSSDQAGSLR